VVAGGEIVVGKWHVMEVFYSRFCKLWIQNYRIDTKLKIIELKLAVGC
jgi:hypothetical protein